MSPLLLKRSLLICLVLWFSTLQLQSQDLFTLTGKIVSQGYLTDTLDICFLPTTCWKVVLPSNEHVSYRGCRWTPVGDSLLCNQIVQKNGIRAEQVVLFNLAGKLLDTVFSAPKQEQIADYYASPKEDRLLIFTTYYPSTSASGNFSLYIVNLLTRSLEVTHKGLCTQCTIDLNENTWLIDGRRFIYYKNKNRQVFDEARKQYITQTSPDNGLYLYDIALQSSSFLQSASLYACSPIEDTFVYLKNHQLQVYTTSQNANAILYTMEKNEYPTKIHWSADGKYVLLAYYKYRFGFDFLSYYQEKLIRVEDKQVISHAFLKHIARQEFSWK